MRIGLVSCYPFYFPGGIQEQIKGLYRFLKSKGHYVKVLAPRYKDSEHYGKDFILYGKSMPFVFNASTAAVSLSFNLDKIKNTLEREKFDILHFHNIGFFTPLQILGFSKAKNILTIHTLSGENYSDKLILDIIKSWAKSNLPKKFESMIVVSNPVYKYAKDAYKGPTYIIPNAIDLKKFNQKNSKISKFHDSKLNILFVGRFDERKGLEYLIDAFDQLKKKHQNIRLIIVGGGSNKEKYIEDVKKRKLRDVFFAGSVRDRDLPKYYSTCDIFCSPATHGESFGVVLLEAMASGKPIVAFANSGYKEVLKDYERKYLVKPKSTKGLIKALDTLIENKDEREKLSKWELREVQKYSWDKVGNEILRVYRSVLSKN